MIKSMRNNKKFAKCYAALAIIASLTTATGCQVEVGGQTLPSAYYLTDDVEFYAPGPEFKLAREAAALKEYKEAQDSESE